MSLIFYYTFLVSVGMIAFWSAIFTWVSLQMLYYLNAMLGSILIVVSIILFFKLIF